MNLVRTILAFAIAMSLAVLPLGASVGHVMSPDHGAMAMQMDGHDGMSMDDCCPDDVKPTDTQSKAYKCGMGLCCIGGALALSEVAPISFAFLSVTASKLAIPADQVAASGGSSPPFRPPRV